MSEDVECHHDPGVLVWYGKSLDLMETLENAFLQVVKTDSLTKKSVFEVLAEGSDETKTSEHRLETCYRLLGSL